MKKIQCRLVGFEFKEWVGNRLNWEVNRINFGDFRLLLGNNAQGKTRLFNILAFLHQIHVGSRPFHNPDYLGECSLHFKIDEEDVIYKLNIAGDVSAPGFIYKEVISKGSTVLFDRSNDILVDEMTGKRIDNFFIPENSPVTFSVKEQQYPTIVELGKFFEHMLFLQANRFSSGQTEISKNASILNETGSNSASVLLNWKDKSYGAYKETLETLKDIFPYVSDVSVRETPINGLANIPMLFLKEKNIDYEIEQVNWSDGLLRTLCLIMLPITRFVNGSSFSRPSFICIDEIENGLDFRTLTKVIEHYENYSNLVQIAIATHSPVVCNLTNTENWLIVSRNKSTVNVVSPENVEGINLERVRLKDDNWDFYSRHIAISPKYIANSD
jgi:hypothetical protein